MAEPGTRFSHLLQPIKDLSKVWNIDIAEELEKYCEEVSQLVVTNPEDGITQLNFAEAALLIQGSTAIYSRKVELLYQLVYQALDLLASEKLREAGGRKKNCPSGLWAPIPETEELLTIDHLIKEGRNILLDGSQEQRQPAMQHRIPLFLMPRDKSDRRKSDFRISSCTIHHTGAYLLQESDSKLLDELLERDESIRSQHPDIPLAPPPPREVQELDDRLQELLRALPEHGGCTDLVASPGSPGAADGFAGMKVPEASPMKRMGTTPRGSAIKLPGSMQLAAMGADPWALLDEHERVGQDLPLEPGRTTRRLDTKKLLASADQLPEMRACDPVSDDLLWSDAAAANLGTMLTAGHPVESLFLAVAGQLKTGGRCETQRAGFSGAWVEFEDLFAAAMARRRQLRSLLRTKPGGRGEAAPETPRRAGDGEESEAGDVAQTPVKVSAGVSSPPGGGVPFGTPLAVVPTEEQLLHEDQRREVARLENMIQDAEHQFEATVRSHLMKMQKDGMDGDNSKYQQVYANVRRWQEQLAPVLKEFESRPEFDMHQYGTKLLAKMSDLLTDNEEEEEDKVIKFSRLVHGQPRWEVCRRFLTCLILTNQGNTDITFESEEERTKDFGLRLLSTDRSMLALEGHEGSAAPVPLAPAARRGRKHPRTEAGPEPAEAAEVTQRAARRARAGA